MNAERRADLAEDLPEIGRHTSERERRASEAERELVQWKKVRFMADKVGDVFEGYITGVSAFGLYIELVEHFVEGMVHVSTMADDYYRFVERAHLLRGEKNGRVYRLGDRVSVQVIRVDLERRQIDLGLDEILEAVRKRGGGNGRGSGPTGRRGRAAAPRGGPTAADAIRPRPSAGRRPVADRRAVGAPADRMASIVIGTAGHVDHGKTALVRALTGEAGAAASGDEAALAARRGDRNALDRLKDEQHRGITIDLGFAHMRIGATEVAFVDVPGHERFVRNMLAGAGGFDAVLLVVAADESVKPQTREHLAICRLLGLERGLIALTKVDLADPETHALAALEVRELVAGTFLADAPIVPVSVRTLVGLDALRRALGALTVDPARRGVRREAVRLPVDRGFSAKGFGTIVTGTLLTGAIAEGDELDVLPEGRRVRVRGLHVHHQAVPKAEAPRRVAVNLGQVGLEDVPRGVTLASPGSLAVSSRLDVRVDLLADRGAVAHGRRVRLHLGTVEIGARVALCATRPRDGSAAVWRPAAVGEVAVAIPPGGSAMARLRLDQPTAATRGDRFVLRAGSPVTTIGGGVVLDPEPPARGLRRLPALPRFVRLSDEHGGPGGPPLVFLQDAGGRGLTAADLARRAGLGRSAAATAPSTTWVADGQGRRGPWPVV